jgi:hypothetical protein
MTGVAVDAGDFQAPGNNQLKMIEGSAAGQCGCIFFPGFTMERKQHGRKRPWASSADRGD